MSDEEESMNDDFEFQKTQREIEDLRHKEEELMSKMNAIANKRKSTSENSLEDKVDEDDDSNEEIGEIRRPSQSKGSSEIPKERPNSIHIEKSSYDARAFRSKESSNSSLTKEITVSSSKNSRASSTKSSRDSSRSSLASPNKDKDGKSTIYITQSRGSLSSSTSPVKSNSGRVSVRSSSGSLASSPTKRNPPGRASPTKDRRSSSSKIKKRSYSTPDETFKNKNKKDLPKSSEDIAARKKIDSSGDDFQPDLDSKEKTRRRKIETAKKASSTSNLSSVDVPENRLTSREQRGSRSSSHDERSKNSIYINEDSYEIIEIEDDDEEQEKKLTARQKIEQELAEQQEREDELKKAHHARAEENHVDKESFEDHEGSDEAKVYEEDINGEDNDEEDDQKITQLSTWEKIALEIEEEKKREVEIKQRKQEDQESKDSGEGEENDDYDEEKNSMDVSAKINLEIEEQIKREEELRRASESGKDDDSDSEEDIANDDGAKEISVQDRIEIEIKEIEKREKELKKMHIDEEPDAIDSEEDSMEDNPVKVGNELNSRQFESRSKIQQEIDEFKKKEAEFRKLHGMTESNNSDDENGEEKTSNGMSLIEKEFAEQKLKETEYRQQHMHVQEKDNEEEAHDDAKMASDEDNGYDEIPQDESILLERENKRRSPVGKNKRENKEDVSVTPGITRRFIHLFDKAGDGLPAKKKEPFRGKSTKKENMETFRTNGHSTKTSSDIDDVFEDEKRLSDEDAAIDLTDKEDIDSDEDEDSKLEVKEDVSEDDNHEVIYTPAPGKKLVLKRKKTKRKEEEEEEEMNKGKSKELKTPKKTHQLAMHWEKLQQENQVKAHKNDTDSTKKQKEAERRHKIELQEKRELERANRQHEIKKLQDRRKNLADAWEGKNVNNNIKSSPKQTTETKLSPTKELTKAKSPRKSPTAKKDAYSANKSQTTPKSARANIKIWEQRIASSQNK